MAQLEMMGQEILRFVPYTDHEHYGQGKEAMMHIGVMLFDLTPR